MNKRGIVGAMVAMWCLAGCTALETRPVKVTQVYPPGSVKPPGSDAEAEEAKTVMPAPVQLGQSWTYRRLDLSNNTEITRFRQDFLARDRSGDWMVRWTTLEGDGSRAGDFSGEAFDPVSHGFGDKRMAGRHEPLKFPLTVGKTWQFQYSLELGEGKRVQISQNARVIGWETISLPAGEFRSLRIDHAGRYTSTENGESWKGELRESFWYAPAARRIVAREYRDYTVDGQPWDQWRDELVEMKLQR